MALSGEQTHNVQLDIRYARSGGAAIAYQVVGTGPTDLVFVPEFMSNLVYGWEIRHWREFYEKISSFSTSAAPACPTTAAASPRSRRAWKMCAPSWTPSARARRLCWLRRRAAGWRAYSRRRIQSERKRSPSSTAVSELRRRTADRTGEGPALGPSPSFDPKGATARRLGEADGCACSSDST